MATPSTTKPPGTTTPPKVTADLRLTSLVCLRRHDLFGEDEAQVQVNSYKTAVKGIKKGEVVTLTDSVPFTDSAKVSLLESGKVIGDPVKVLADQPAVSPIEFKTSGTHYVLNFDVVRT